MATRSALRRLPCSVVVMVTSVALLVASCGVEAGRRSSVAGTPSGDVVGADPGTTSTTAADTTTTTAPPPDVSIQGTDGSATNETIANAISDLQSWWATEFAKLYGKRYRPVAGGFFAIDSNSSTDGLPCSPSDISDVLDNAYYCTEDDAVVWDQEGLMPDLAKKFGSFTPAVVLSHEWGHAIQARAGFDAPTVILEQQADCFAGAWVRHVRDDNDARFRITIDDLDNALAGFLSLRDSPGSTANDPNAHGSGFDRVKAFQEGFEESATRCKEYREGDPKPFQFGFDPNNPIEEASSGDLPLETTDPNNPGIDQQAFHSLDFYWTMEYPKISGGKDWDPLVYPKPFSPDDPPTCDGKTVRDYRLFVCIPDRYIGYDNVDKIPSTYEKGGDFAVATLFATQYGLDVEEQLGETPSDEVTATLRGDCYAGSWAAAILPPGMADDTKGITLSPGDLDEAVGVLLSSRSDADRKRQGPGFDRVRAFRVGVLKGADACTDVEPS